MKWTIVSVKDVKAGAQWCRENLSYSDWVVGEKYDGTIEFRFRDAIVATEFVLRCS